MAKMVKSSKKKDVVKLPASSRMQMPSGSGNAVAKKSSGKSKGSAMASNASKNKMGY